MVVGTRFHHGHDIGFCGWKFVFVFNATIQWPIHKIDVVLSPSAVVSPSNKLYVVFQSPHIYISIHNDVLFVLPYGN